MFKTIRGKLIATYLILICLPLALLGIFLLQALTRFYLDQLEKDLAAEALLMADEVQLGLRTGHTIPVAQLINHPPPPLQTRARVLVLNEEGRLVAASRAEDRAFLGEPVDEPGVAEALAGGLVRGVKRSPGRHTDVAFAAAPVRVGDLVIGVVHLDYALTELDAALRQLRLIVGLSILGAGLLVILIGFRLASAMTAPIQQLVAGTAAIAAGDYAHRVEVTSGDELEALAQHFNRMAANLQAQQAAQRSMLANIAHDVRTPLGAVQAALEALRDGALEEPATARRLLQGLTDHVAYLGRLTESLVRLARYQSAEFHLQQVPTALKDLVDQVILTYRAQAAASGIELSSQVPDGLPLVAIDPDRMTEALINLIDNALHATPPGGRVTVSAGVDGHHVWLRVRDTGPGIPAGRLPHLFDAFYHDDHRRGRARSGHGLGLLITRAIIEAHGGTIHAENAPQGGALFQITLPLIKT